MKILNYNGLNYFLKYGNLTPQEDTDEDINTEIDNLTMLVESLMSNTNPLDLVLDINGTKVTFYPKAPYGKTDYKIEVTLDCGFDEKK